MIRGLVKAAAAATLQRTGVAAWVGSRPARAALPLVIGYHRVVDDFRAQARGYMPSMLISTATLERQLDWIGRRYEFADPDGMDRWLAGERPAGKPVAVITFDDGYRDVYEQAFPLLKRKGIPAIVFMVTDLVGCADLQIHDELFLSLAQALASWPEPQAQLQALLRQAGVTSAAIEGAPAAVDQPLPLTRLLLGHLCQEELQSVIRLLRAQGMAPEARAADLMAMDWVMVARMRDAGIKIGSHTRSHALLTNESTRKIAEELRTSRQALERHLGEEVKHFAYPDGRFDRAVVAAVAAAGYRYAYTTCRHRDAQHPDLSIPRRLLWENACVDGSGRFSPAVMSCQVNGVFDFVANCRIDHAA